MATVPTARGDVDTSELGFTLMHEHLKVESPNVRANWPHLFPDYDRAAEIDYAVKVLDEAYETGIHTIVELTTVDLGRDTEFVQEVAERSPVHLIVSTGIHSHPPLYLSRGDPDLIVPLYVHDIEEGIAGTGIRAGVIKVATDAAVTEANAVQLRAAARAHRQTGAPIITHSSAPAETGRDQQDLFEEEGVDLTRVLIGHVGDTTDLDYLTSLLERGSIIGMDRFGLPMVSFEDRVATVAELCKRGFASQLALAHDANTYLDVSLREARQGPVAEDWNFFTVSRKVLPALSALGVSEEQQHTMMVENPRRFFEAQGAY